MSEKKPRLKPGTAKPIAAQEPEIENGTTGIHEPVQNVYEPETCIQPVYSQAEVDECTRLIREVHEGLATFLRVGAALLRLKEIYGASGEYLSFEDFCFRTFGVTRDYGYKQIWAYKFDSALADAGVSNRPKCEAPYRPWQKCKEIGTAVAHYQKMLAQHPAGYVPTQTDSEEFVSAIFARTPKEATGVDKTSATFTVDSLLGMFDSVIGSLDGAQDLYPEAINTIEKGKKTSYRKKLTRIADIIRELDDAVPKSSESLSKQWDIACGEALEAIERLESLQGECQEACDNAPENFAESEHYQKLQAIAETDLSDAKSAIEEAQSA